MSNYTFNTKYITKPPDVIFDVIKEKLTEDGFFLGIGHGKEFKVNRISPLAIYYTGADRSSGKQEDLGIEELKAGIEELKKLHEFNTNTTLLKERISNVLYRKRTPFFGILTHTDIIVVVENN
jgi:hypothetical protein